MSTIAASSSVLTIVVAMLLASCASYQARPIDPVQRAIDFSERRLDSTDLAAFAAQNAAMLVTFQWPPQRWDLDTLTMAAFFYHPDLDVARANYAIARAGILTAGGRPNPSASLQLQHTSPSNKNSPWSLGFSFDISIETAGKRGLRIRRARELTDASRYNIAAAAWQVRRRLRLAFVDYGNAHDAVTLLTRQTRIQTDIVEILQKRLSYGEGSLLEATQAKISAAQTALQLRDAERRQADSLARVAAAVGVPVAALDGVNLAPPPSADVAVADVARADLRTAALTGRADLLALLSEYEAAQSALQLEIAKQYPDLRIGPGYLWDQGMNKWSLGLSVTLPIVNQKGPIAEAETRRREKAARINALQATIIGDLDRAIASYRSALEKVTTASSAFALNEQQEREVRRRFDAGETDRLDLRTNELQTNTSALARLDAAAAAEQALGAVEDALQRPLTGARIDPNLAIPAPREEKP